MSTETPGRWFPWMVAALTLAPYYALLVPDSRVIATNEYCDYATYYLPVREFARDEIKSGRFPLWIPWVGCGMPLHAMQQAALCHPLLTPLTAALPANDALRLSMFLSLALCVAGQYNLARTLGMSRGASSFGAIVPTQSGFVVAHLMEGHITHILGFGLVPFLLLALIRHLRRPSAGSTLALALAGALLIVSGHPQLPYYVVVFSFLWGAGSLLFGTAAKHRVRCVCWSAIAVAVAVAIGMIQLVPTLELMSGGLGASDRGSVEYASMFALDGVDLLHLFMPNLRGNPLADIPEFPPYHFFHERAGYIGLAAIALSVFALSRESSAPWEWGAAALIVLSFVIALGRATPLFDLLGQVAAGLHYFRCPGRVLSLATVLTGLLAARGLDAANRAEAGVTGLHRAVFLVCILATANGAAYVVLDSAASFPWSGYGAYASSYLAYDFAASAVFAVGTAMALRGCLCFGRVHPAWTSSFLLAVAIVDLGYFNATNFQLRSIQNAEIPESVLAVEPAIRYVEVPRGNRIAASEIRYSKSVPLAIRHQRGMLGTNDGGVLPPAVERLYRALEVNTEVALAASACNYQYHSPTNSWEEVRFALPRCRFIAEERSEITQIPLESLDLGQLLATAQIPSASPRIVTENAQTAQIEIDAPVAGTLVVADTVYPGWRCTVDGEETQIEAVHGVFRGVRIGPGPHKVQFTFEPRSFFTGWCAALLGAGAIFGLGVTEIAHQRRRLAEAGMGRVRSQECLATVPVE